MRLVEKIGFAEGCVCKAYPHHIALRFSSECDMLSVLWLWLNAAHKSDVFTSILGAAHKCAVSELPLVPRCARAFQSLLPIESNHGVLYFEQLFSFSFQNLCIV